MLKQPIGQKRLTNVAVVRYKKFGKKFEIACYKNKVLSWRNKVEKDIDEVLQAQIVYSNVSKGVLAKKEDLMQVFGMDDQEKICLLILEQGELQVSDKEREAQYSSLYRDVATIVMDKCVNSDTQRPYTVGMIERFMREVHFKIDPAKTPKQIALELIRVLQKRFPISRARMKLRLTLPQEHEEKATEWLDSISAVAENKEKSGNVITVSILVDPGSFRGCDTFAREHQGRLEVVSLAVQEEGEQHVEDFELSDASSAQLVSPSKAVKTSEQVDETTKVFSQASLVDQRSKDDESVGRSRPATTGRPVSSKGGAPQSRLQKCNTCNASFEEAKVFREHFKSDWHRHNLKRRAKGLVPLSAEECVADTDVMDEKSDMDDYSR